MLGRFIKVADKCRDPLRNYDGMMAIYGALGASADTERAHLHLLLTLMPQIIWATCV